MQMNYYVFYGDNQTGINPCENRWIALYRLGSYYLLSNRGSCGYHLYSMSLKSYKFLFHLQLGKLTLSTSFQCTISATWKRSSETAKSQPVEFANGIANFNQTLTLPVNMYFDSNTNSFQQKKSQLSFTLHTPKGDKSAGLVIVDLAIMLNNKLETLEDKFTLDKCPDKNAKIEVKITCEAKGQNNPSEVSGVGPVDVSILSTTSFGISQTPAKAPKEEITPQQVSAQEKAKNVGKQNTALKAELASPKASLKPSQPDSSSKKQTDRLNSQIASLKSELSKSRSSEQSLQTQLSTLRRQYDQQQSQLQLAKSRLEQIYQEFQKYI